MKNTGITDEIEETRLQTCPVLECSDFGNCSTHTKNIRCNGARSVMYSQMVKGSHYTILTICFQYQNTKSQKEKA